MDCLAARSLWMAAGWTAQDGARLESFQWIEFVQNRRIAVGALLERCTELEKLVLAELLEILEDSHVLESRDKLGISKQTFD